VLYLHGSRDVVDLVAKELGGDLLNILLLFRLIVVLVLALALCALPLARRGESTLKAR